MHDAAAANGSSANGVQECGHPIDGLTRHGLMRAHIATAASMGQGEVRDRAVLAQNLSEFLCALLQPLQRDCKIIFRLSLSLLIQRLVFKGIDDGINRAAV